MNLKSLSLIGYDEEVFHKLDLPIGWKVNHVIKEPNLVISQLLSWGPSRLRLIREWGSKVMIISKVSYIHDPSFSSFVESLDNPTFVYLREDLFLDFAVQAGKKFGWKFQELDGLGYNCRNLTKINLHQVMNEELGREELYLDWVNAKGKGYCYVVLNSSSNGLTKKQLQGNLLTIQKGTLVPSNSCDRLIQEWIGMGNLHLEVVSFSLHDYMRLVDRLSYSYLSKFFHKISWRTSPAQGPHESIDLRNILELTDKFLDEIIYETVEGNVKGQLRIKARVKVIKIFKVKQGGKMLDVWGVRLLEGTLRRDETLWLEWSSFKINNITIKGVEIEIARQGDEIGLLLDSYSPSNQAIKLDDILLKYEDSSLISSLVKHESRTS